MDSPSRWPAIRAGLIATVIAVNLLIALPAPMRLDAAKLARPEAVEEVEGWVTLLGSVGIITDRATLNAWVIAGSNRFAELRQTWIARPTRPLRRWLGIRQAWALFARPDTFPGVLAIDVRDGPHSPWSEVYRSHHPDHDLLRPQLRFRRVRGVYDVSASPGAGPQNVFRWAADRILAEQPDAHAVRVRLIRTHSVRPDQAPDPRQQVLYDQIFRRETP